MAVHKKIMGGLGDFSKMWSGGSTQNPSTVWEGQSPYLTDMFSRAQQASYGNEGQQFGQQFQNPAFNAFNQQAGGGFGMDAGSLNSLQQMAQGNQQNTALNGAITAGLDQMGQNFNRNVMPGIDQGAAAAGTAGGSRQGIAQGMAANDFNLASSQFVNQMQSDNFNNILQSQNQAFGQLNQYGANRNNAQQGAMGNANNLANLGFGNQYGNLQGLKGILGSPTVLSGGGETTKGIRQGAGDAIAIGGAIFSDERLKDNIEKVGELDNGLPVYTFTYKGETTTQLGLIAQDVEKVNPDAVSNIGGYKAVNYSEAAKGV